MFLYFDWILDFPFMIEALLILYNNYGSKLIKIQIWDVLKSYKLYYCHAQKRNKFLLPFSTLKRFFSPILKGLSDFTASVRPERIFSPSDLTTLIRINFFAFLFRHTCWKFIQFEYILQKQRKFGFKTNLNINEWEK